MSKTRMWATAKWSLSLWACSALLMAVPLEAFFTDRSEGSSGRQELGEVVGALDKIAQVLDSHERHVSLYERVSKLEESLNKKTENELRLETEMQELRAKIPLLEAEIETIPEMRKELAEFAAKIEKLVHDYEAKLSTLASEVIRLKKNGARRKDLQTLSDGRDNVQLRIDAPVCPEFGTGMAAERIGDQCLYFSWGTAMNWKDAHRHCQSLRGDLAAPPDLLPLKTFLHAAFARGPSIWLGASYNIENERNGTSDSAEDKVRTTSANLTDHSTVDPIEIDAGGSLASILDLSGAPDIASNRIDGDVGDGEMQDDETSGPSLSDGVVLHDDPGELLSSFASFSSLFGSSIPVEKPKSRTSGKPVVDLVLLEDSTAEHLGKSSHPDLALSIGRNQPRRSSMSSSSILSRRSAIGSPPSTASTGISRDVREVLEEGSGMQDSSSSSAAQDAGKAKMNCMLLQQKESLEYELIGKPCNEEHIFVCEILSTKGSDLKFPPDNLLHD